MKKKNISAYIWLAAGVLLIVFAVRHFHIKNFHTVSDGLLYTSGQMRGMDYDRLLYKYHIATIINLRSPDEHRDHNWYNQEITWVKQNGVKYFELPVDKNGSGFPDIDTIEKFLKITENSENMPVLIHDGSGKQRCSFLASVWMLKKANFSIEQIISKVEEINGQSVTEPQREFLYSLKK